MQFFATPSLGWPHSLAALALTFWTLLAWGIWMRYMWSYGRKTAQTIHACVSKHLTDGLNLARPYDTPGADPGTKHVVFERCEDGSVLITRRDWRSPRDKCYIIAPNGKIKRNLLPAGMTKPTIREFFWVYSLMSKKRYQRLWLAVDGHYRLASKVKSDGIFADSI